MIETNSDYKRFQQENLDGDWIVHVIPVEDGVHPADNKPSILFIRNTSTGRTYYYAFDHPDSKPKVSISEFLENDRTKWALDKKSFRQILKLPNICDDNLCRSLRGDEIKELSDFETPTHNLIRRNANGMGRINKAIPLMKHKEMFESLCDSVENSIKKCELNSSFFQVNDVTLETLGDIESNGIYVDSSLFAKHFESAPNSHGLVFSQYNIYTSTGRPSNRFGGINYAALNHSDGSRSCFVSRYGKDGRIVVVDYTAFHPRIICNLTKYPLSVNTDIYEYLAKLYFKKKEVDETDIKEAKQLTFRQLYGGVEEEYSHIKYLSNLKTFINEQWEFFKKNNYIETPIFKRRITDKHIQDPSPTKVFNYILQAVEGEVAIPKIQEVLKYLRGKQTKAVLYTYDAVIYDFYKDDGLETLNTIRKIMSYDGMFPMKTYIGSSYHNVQQVNI